MLYLYTLLTLAVFYLALQFNKRWKLIWLNPFIFSLLLLIAFFVLTKLPYEDYKQGNQPLNHLLTVSIVALAIPLYEQWPQIQKRWKILLFITALASLFTMLSGALLALLLGATPEVVATLLPKSVTTPLAMTIVENLGGIPSVAAVGVIIAGLQGALFGYMLLKILPIRHSEAIGLAIGSASHVLGTAACMEMDKKAGSYGSIALVLCGIMSAILAPFVFKLIYFFVAL